MLTCIKAYKRKTSVTCYKSFLSSISLSLEVSFHLETFKEIRGTNIESTEQSNRFLNRLKDMHNQMTKCKFKETHNERMEERLKYKEKMKYNRNAVYSK